MKTREELLSELKQLAEDYVWLDYYWVEYIDHEGKKRNDATLAQIEVIKHYE